MADRKKRISSLRAMARSRAYQRHASSAAVHPAPVPHDTGAAGAGAGAAAESDQRRAGEAARASSAGRQIRLRDDVSVPWWRRALAAAGLDCFVGADSVLADVGLSDEEIEYIVMMVPFTKPELAELVDRFLADDRDSDREISAEELAAIPELACSPFCDRIVEVFEEDRPASRRGQPFTFLEYLTALSVFSENGRKSDKIRFLFRLYDRDSSGTLSRADLEAVVAAQVAPDEFGADDVADVVDRAMREMGADESVDYGAFARAVSGSSVQTQLLFKLS